LQNNYLINICNSKGEGIS